MSAHTLRLRYGALLLELIRREARWGRLTNWLLVNDLCDRFERLMATFERAPLLWIGDNA